MPNNRVLLLSHEYAPFHGGVATYVHEIAVAALEAGSQVEVWTVDYKGRIETMVERCKANVNESSVEPPVVRLSSSGRLTPAGLLSFARSLWQCHDAWRNQPVVLLSVGAQMAFFLLSLVGCRTDAKVTCFFHGSEVLRFQRNPCWRWLARRFYRREADCFGVTTRYVEALLRGSGLVPAGADIVLAPCALPRAFHVEQTEADLARQDRVRETNPLLRVLTVARLHPRKGQLEVARALALLPDMVRKRVIYQVVGVGEAAYRRQVEVVCREGGVRCDFLGALADRDLGKVYTHATVYAQASRTLPQSVEGFGITFLEAAAYGCPAAAWRSGGVAEAVLDGETGLLVEESDLPGLSAAIGRLLENAELRKTLGARGREFARSFRWERAAEVLCRSVGNQRRVK